MTKLDYSILKQISLLYVEDDAAVQNIFAELFEKRVGQLHIASNGQEGYDKYIEHKPDIILTDINMPKVTGLEMAKKIRAVDDEVAIFITTAYNNTEFISESLYLNICGYLVKPVNKNELFSMLVGRAKLILSQKQNMRNLKMLQSIINADTHMLAVTDLKTISFANRTFTKFLGVEDAEEFNQKYDSFDDIFIEQDGYLHKGLLQKGDDLMELLLKTSISKRNVLIFDFNQFTPKAFEFKLTPIDRVDNHDIYLATLVDISSTKLENVEMKNKIYFDNLTGIYNRNKVDDVFKDVIGRANRYGETFSMVLIDIDHFKSFNDTYGHLIGDEVLKTKRKKDIQIILNNYINGVFNDDLLKLFLTDWINISIIREASIGEQKVFLNLFLESLEKDPLSWQNNLEQFTKEVDLLYTKIDKMIIDFENSYSDEDKKIADSIDTFFVREVYRLLNDASDPTFISIYIQFNKEYINWYIKEHSFFNADTKLDTFKENYRYFEELSTKLEYYKYKSVVVDDSTAVLDEKYSQEVQEVEKIKECISRLRVLFTLEEKSLYLLSSQMKTEDLALAFFRSSKKYKMKFMAHMSPRARERFKEHLDGILSPSDDDICNAVKVIIDRFNRLVKEGHI
jgi:response regulator of citrate/malate metabolism